eukprot:COSAG01_NODE_4017_length_5430_cov_4.544926_1_plen_117_part_10
MYKEVILPAYKKRLVGPDIHKAPPTFELKAMFTRMAAIWEAESAQKRFDTSPGQSANTSVSFHANTVVTTDKINLKYTTFENMSASTPHPRQEPETLFDDIKVAKNPTSASYGPGQP